MAEAGGRLIHSISTRGGRSADYAHHISTRHPRFSDLPPSGLSAIPVVTTLAVDILSLKTHLALMKVKKVCMYMFTVDLFQN